MNMKLWMSNEQLNVNDYEQNIIKVKNNNTNEMSDVMSSILEMLWLNNEQYFMDWTILMIR